MTIFIAYVSPECVGCVRTFRLAGKLVELTGRDDVVKLIDVTAGHVQLPDDLFAVPTWYVDGVRFSLGNPTETQLIDRLATDCPSHELGSNSGWQ